MKKITLVTVALSLFISFQSHAQIFDSESFNTLTIGNIGTNATGDVAGQGGFKTLTASGLNSDFQVIDIGSSDKALQIFGSNTATGSRFIWKDGLDTFWSSTRASTNNIIEVEFWFFTGPATTSKNEINIEIYDAGYTKVIAGLAFSPETKIIQGLLYANGGSGLATYYVSLGNEGLMDVTLLENTWHKVGVSFNVATGQVIYRSNDFYIGFVGSAAGIIPFETDISIYAGTGNTTSAFFVIDDFEVRAVPTEMLLSNIEGNKALSQKINLFPNPVVNVLNFEIPNGIKVDKFEIYDVNGRLIKTIANKTMRHQIPVSDLNSGVYLLNIYSGENKITKKFIKK